MAKKKEQPQSSIPSIKTKKPPVEFWDSSKYKTYADKLKHPLWQRKRLEMFDRDDWTCRVCGDQQTTLNVHHRYYVNGKHPWEYDESALITLCEPCHKQEEADIPKAVEVITSGLRKHGCMAYGVEQFGKVLFERYIDMDIPGMLGYLFFDQKTFDIVKSRLFEYRDSFKKNTDV